MADDEEPPAPKVLAAVRKKDRERKPLTAAEVDELLKLVRQEDRERAAFVMEPIAHELPKAEELLAKLPASWAAAAVARTETFAPPPTSTSPAASIPTASRTPSSSEGTRLPSEAVGLGTAGVPAARAPPQTIDVGYRGRHAGEDVEVVRVLEGSDEVLVRTARGDVRYVPRGELTT